MQKVIQILSLLIFCTLSSVTFAQNKQYVYYFDHNMQNVAKENASIIGKGVRRDSVFMVQYAEMNNDRLFLIESYKDSLLDVLHGVRVVYHPNRKVAEKSFFNNNKLFGSFMRWDSLGRVVDSSYYYDEMPMFIVQYKYLENNDRQKIKEYSRSYYSKEPDENAAVYTIDGMPLSTAIWKQLNSTGKYALKKDLANDNSYLIYKLSDDFYNSQLAKYPEPKESKFFKIGQSFNINDIDIQGNKLKSKDLKGTLLVVNFWFINCPPCRAEIPDLNELAAKYKDNDKVKFIGVALDNKKELQQFLKIRPFNYQIVENGRNIAEKYGVNLYPTHVIIDGDGKVQFHTVSSPRNLAFWMKKVIDELLVKQKSDSDSK